MPTMSYLAVFTLWLACSIVTFVSSLAVNPTNIPALSIISQAPSNLSGMVELLPSLINNTNSSTLKSPTLINTTNSSVSSSNRVIEWTCSRAAAYDTWDYGRSCFDAVRQMAFVPGSATRQFTWGQREELRNPYDVNLPQRVYSCKGSPPFA